MSSQLRVDEIIASTTTNVSIGGTGTVTMGGNITFAEGSLTAGKTVINANSNKLTAGTLEYDAIDKTISDTAVDIFIYDTSKDSDGGAWRKRTTHTSWYNETLNTATRGSRREFPAVAVIVAEQNFIKIYDGDDPDLPMWMVFNTICLLYTSPSPRD